MVYLEAEWLVSKRFLYYYNLKNAIRIVLSTLNTTANKYGKYITPLLSYQSEFYVRVFVRVRIGKLNCWSSFEKMGNIFHCDTCYNFH